MTPPQVVRAVSCLTTPAPPRGRGWGETDRFRTPTGSVVSGVRVVAVPGQALVGTLRGCDDPTPREVANHQHATGGV